MSCPKKHTTRGYVRMYVSVVTTVHNIMHISKNFAIGKILSWKFDVIMYVHTMPTGACGIDILLYTLLQWLLSSWYCKHVIMTCSWYVQCRVVPTEGMHDASILCLHHSCLCVVVLYIMWVRLLLDGFFLHIKITTTDKSITLRPNISQHIPQHTHFFRCVLKFHSEFFNNNNNL